MRSSFRYINFIVVSFLTSLLGSHCVYLYYEPMADFNELIHLEFEEIMKEFESNSSNNTNKSDKL